MLIKRILIVDDDYNLTLMLTASLEKLGADYFIDVAHNTKEALTKIKQIPFDLLITDQQMPNMTGTELIEIVHKISPKTRIILMTAYGSRQLHQTLQSLKLDSYIDKPFKISIIRDLVKNFTQLPLESTHPPEK